MQENKEEWVELCGQLDNEKDNKKFMALITQIDAILKAKELALKGEAPSISH